MRLWSRISRLEEATARETISFHLEGGTTARFYEDEVWPGCFLHESERGGRHFDGEDPGPAHPFVEALRHAAEGEVERLESTQGTVLGLWLGEDEIVRGLRERPGPPGMAIASGVVEWVVLPAVSVLGLAVIEPRSHQ